HHHERVTIGNPIRPPLNGLCGVLSFAPDGRCGLVEERQRIVTKVEELNLDVRLGSGFFGDPVSWLVAEPALSGGAEDNFALDDHGFAPRYRRPRRLDATTSASPDTTAMMPFTAQRVWPDMKLPGSTFTPCRNHTVPIKIRIVPAIVIVDFIGLRPPLPRQFNGFGVGRVLAFR